jgi:hypothetical protein
LLNGRSALPLACKNLDLNNFLEAGFEIRSRYLLIVYLWSMITKAEILSKLSELKPILYRDYSVKEIGLFGSYSDESCSEESDIDLLVDLEKPIGWRFFTLELFLEGVFNKKIDLVTKNALKEPIKDDILRQVKYVK